MQASLLSENIPESSAEMQSRVVQLEETIRELYQSFCPVYGTIDFAELSPSDFGAPYSTHAVPIPHTKLSVALMTAPPHLILGSPASHTPGPLHWEHKLEIEFPVHTAFVSFQYGGETGNVDWFSVTGVRHHIPMLPPLNGPDDTGQFYLAGHEGISRMEIIGTGKMFLTTLSVGLSAHTGSH